MQRNDDNSLFDGTNGSGSYRGWHKSRIQSCFGVMCTSNDEPMTTLLMPYAHDQYITIDIPSYV
jgi:hypothetical protein